MAAAPKPGNWGGSFLAVPKAGKNTEEAAKLAAWLTAPEQQAKLFAKRGSFPSAQAAYALPRGRRREARVLRRRARSAQIFAEAAEGVPVPDRRPEGPDHRAEPGRHRHAPGRPEGPLPAGGLGRRREGDRQRPGPVTGMQVHGTDGRRALPRGGAARPGARTRPPAPADERRRARRRRRYRWT